jgi:hypothetical protein
MKDIKKLYNDLIDLRNRLSNEGSGQVFEEDHLLLDAILDYIDRDEPLHD